MLNKNKNELTFLYNGNKILPHETPKELNLQPNSII